MPGWRYAEFANVLQGFQAQCAQSGAETIREVAWSGLRLVNAYHPIRALERYHKRRAKMAVSALKIRAPSHAGQLSLLSGKV